MTARPGDSIVLNRRFYQHERVALVAVAALGGILLGTITTLSVAPVCALPAPRTVSHTLIEIGRGLCEKWEGLANITRTAEEVYTFECARYATFAGLEVRLAEYRGGGCSTDSECEGVRP